MANWLAALFMAVLALSGCSDKPAGDTAGQTLRVADQLDRLRTVLTAANEHAPSDYRLEWSGFFGGPAAIAAETGGSIDVAWMAETPLVFAQAAGSPVKVIAAGRPAGTSATPFGLAVAAGSPIRAVGELKGRKILFMRGTVSQYFLLQMLEGAGLSLDDIEPVNAVPGAETALLESGQVDAVTMGDPALATALDSGKIRVLPATGAPLRPSLYYLVAPTAALADPAKRALLADFVARVSRANQWFVDHPDAAAQSVAKYYKLPPRLAAKALDRTLIRFAPIDDGVIADHQFEADAFARIGLIRAKLDARDIFDTRFNDAVASAGAGK